MRIPRKLKKKCKKLWGMAPIFYFDEARITPEMIEALKKKRDAGTVFCSFRDEEKEQGIQRITLIAKPFTPWIVFKDESNEED